MKRFELCEIEWVVGDLATLAYGAVAADGCLFPNGKAVVAWRGPHASVVVWDSLEAMLAVHVGIGKRAVRWIDDVFEAFGE